MEAHRSSRWTRVACIIAAMTGAACSAEDVAAQAEAEVDRRTAERDTRLTAAWVKADGGCRGKSLPEASLHCARRDQLEQELADIGYCHHGQGSAYGYHAEWARFREAACNAPISFGDAQVDNGLSPAEQEKADQLAAAYARDALVQAEVERQLTERRLADERQSRQALELIR